MSAIHQNPFELLRSLKRPKNPIDSEDEDSVSIEKETLNIQWFEPKNSNIIQGKDHVIIGLKANESFAFEGMTLLACLFGAVNINEYQWTAPKQVSDYIGFLMGHCGICPIPKHLPLLPLISSSSESLLKVTARSIGPHIHLNSPPSFTECEFSFMEKLKNWQGQKFQSIVVLFDFSWCGLAGLADCMPMYKDLFNMAPQLETSLVQLPQFHLLDPTKQASIVYCPTSWSQCLSKLVQDPLPIVLCCGPKNSGKSTFCKFAVHRLLSRYEKVAFLECDLGQNEFSIHGFISLNIVQGPILGPAFSHLRIMKHEKMMYMGCKSPLNDPKRYQECIQLLMEEYQSSVHFKGVPLVVNTQGWIRGIGFDLLLQTIHNVQPTMIIALETNIQEPKLGNALRLETHLNVQSLSCAGMKQSKWNSADQRDLSIISYFSQQHPDPMNIHYLEKESEWKYPWWDFKVHPSHRLPFCISKENLNIVVLYHHVHVDYLDQALNGTLCGLVSDMNHAIIPCIVRGIQKYANAVQLLILFPPAIELSDIYSYTILIRGAKVELPVYFFCYAHGNQIPPYVRWHSSEGIGDFSRVTRKNLGRKKLLQY